MTESTRTRLRRNGMTEMITETDALKARIKELERKNQYLKHIIENELNDEEESSVETIDLLELIVYNVSTILNRGAASG